MPKGKNQKFKLYRLAQIMSEQTDEDHYITMPEIMSALEEYEITADRKSIYADLKDLEKLGIEIEGERIGSKTFSRCNSVIKVYHREKNQCIDQEVRKDGQQI